MKARMLSVLLAVATVSTLILVTPVRKAIAQSGTEVTMGATTNSSCSTGPGPGSTCTIVIDWPGAFADTTYAATCNAKSAVANPITLLIPDSNKTTTGMTVEVQDDSPGGGSATVSGLNCVAVDN